MENTANVKVVRIGSKEWAPYENQMKTWFKNWDSVSQANWILANPEDYVKFNDQLRDGALCILNNAGFNFAKYRPQLVKGA
jgi:hypothetical protein